jgi:hypothetical protein
METDNPRTLVLAYHDAFYRNDRAAVRALLKPDGKFIGPLNAFDDADKFLESASLFMRLAERTEIKQIISEGQDVCVLYDGTYKVPSIPTLPIAAWFRVENGKIAFFHVHFDPSAFVRAKQSGEIDRALQAAGGSRP